MESKLQPLKRLCSEPINESPRKKRLTVSDMGAENCDPALHHEAACSSTNWSSLLRVTELEIKPDTPAIPSVRTRIQMLRENSMTEADLNAAGSSDLVHENVKESFLTDPVLKFWADKKEGLDMSSEWEKNTDEPLAQSTIAPRQHLLSHHKPPSMETVRRLRKGTVAGEAELESPNGSLNFVDHFVSSLEVRLRGTVSSGSLKERILSRERTTTSYEWTEEPDEDLSPGRIEDGKSQVTIDNSELIDRLFEGVLDSSSGGSGDDPLEMEIPPVTWLSPLTKSADLQAAISPLNSVASSLPELLMEAPDTPSSSSPDRTRLPYSVDKYRTMKRGLREGLSTQPKVETRSSPPRKVICADLKDTIKLLNKEVSALQRIMEQACCALSCCVDADHGKGSRQEAEAERLLLVSMEKRKALLKELDYLRSNVDEGLEPSCSGNLKPCNSSIRISAIQLPLKVDYVCSSIRNAGYPSHYFLVLIRYGSYDIVATPLASAADAQTGDTILFPTTVTLNDVSPHFKIEIEVYSLAQGGSVTVPDKHKTSKPKITPKKLLGSRVPFLSPLEGSLYLKLHCQSYSAVQHKGFLTMFEDVSGLGAWHRRWCVLSGNYLSFWTYPDQELLAEPLGTINLANCTSSEVEAVKREVCARPHTVELTTMRPQREDDADTLVTQCRNTLCFTKNWLSADDKEQKTQWMDYLNQVLLDLRTWRTSPGRACPDSQA